MTDLVICMSATGTNAVVNQTVAVLFPVVLSGYTPVRICTVLYNGMPEVPVMTIAVKTNCPVSPGSRVIVNPDHRYSLPLIVNDAPGIVQDQSIPDSHQLKISLMKKLLSSLPVFLKLMVYVTNHPE